LVAGLGNNLKTAVERHLLGQRPQHERKANAVGFISLGGRTKGWRHNRRTHPEPSKLPAIHVVPFRAVLQRRQIYGPLLRLLALISRTGDSCSTIDADHIAGGGICVTRNIWSVAAGNLARSRRYTASGSSATVTRFPCQSASQTRSAKAVGSQRFRESRPPLPDAPRALIRDWVHPARA